MQQEKKFILGIDLGTTNSVISFGNNNPRTGKLEAKIITIKSLDEYGNLKPFEILPSYVYFKENEAPQIGAAAKGMMSVQGSRVVKSIKSKMGEAVTLSIDKKKYDPVEISSMILAFLAKKAQEVLRLKTLPNDVVITVPASFNSDQREATLKAAEKAGFRINNDDGSKRNILLDEPRAALFDFIEMYNRNEIPDTNMDLKIPKNILVYDLGGGTLDVSLHKVSYNQNENKVDIQDYAISRYTQIGGDSFDELLAIYLKQILEKKGLNTESLSEFDKNTLFMKLLKLSEETKIELNAEILSELEYNSPTEEELEQIEIEIISPNIWDNRGIGEELSLKKYEMIVQNLLGKDLSYKDYKIIDDIDFQKNNNIIFPILDVLAKAEKKLGLEIKIDAVLLNGGMTKLYPIKRRIENFFGFTPLTLGDEDKSVARGAVYYHDSLHRGVKYNKIQNESIGIEIAGNYIKHIVSAGTILPYTYKITDTFEVSESGTKSIILPFYLGERKDTKEPNRKIASRRVQFDKPLPEGTAIDLFITVDDDGIMNLKGALTKNPNTTFEVSIETSKVEAEIATEIASKTYQEIKTIILPNYSLGPEIDLEEIKYRFEKFFKEKSFGATEYKNMTNKIKNASNGYELGYYLLSKIDVIQKDHKSKIITLLGEIGKHNENLKNLVVEKLISISSENNILKLDIKEISRSIKECVIALGKLQRDYSEGHLLYLLNIPYTLNIQEDLITSIGKVGYSKNALKHLENILENTSLEEIGKNIRLIWSIAKLGTREKKCSISPENLINLINLIKNILKNTNHKELSENCIYGLGELCDSRFGNEVPNDISKEIISFLEELLTTKGSKQQKMIDLTIKMIKGNILTQEEENNLLSIRSKLL
ncbi:MAG: Hsp70 family protein [Fusobacteriaceae bacterium]